MVKDFSMLFKKMERIVSKYVKSFKEDFTTDKEIILAMADEGDGVHYERHLFWIVRKCGTNIGYKSKVVNSATYSYYLSDVESFGVGHRYYELDLEKQSVKLIKDPAEYRKQLKKAS